MALYAKNKVDLLLHGTSIRADRMQFVEFTTDLMPVEWVPRQTTANTQNRTLKFKFRFSKHTNTVSSTVSGINLEYIHFTISRWSLACVHFFIGNHWTVVAYSAHLSGRATTNVIYRCCDADLYGYMPTGHTFSDFKNIRTHYYYNDIYYDAVHLHSIFGEYFGVAAKSKSRNPNDWWFNSITSQTWHSRRTIHSVLFWKRECRPIEESVWDKN